MGCPLDSMSENSAVVSDVASLCEASRLIRRLPPAIGRWRVGEGLPAPAKRPCC